MNKSFTSYKNNAVGKTFESDIEVACEKYRSDKIAVISKIPEPFRVMKKYDAGIFQGRFIARADPDFAGTLENGKSIVFEAKATTTEAIRKNVLSDKQQQMLEEHHKMGAVVGICCAIKNRYFFVPWRVWRDMEKIIGKKSAKAEELKEYEVPYIHGVMFLQNIVDKKERITSANW